MMLFSWLSRIPTEFLRRDYNILVELSSVLMDVCSHFQT